MDKLNVSETLLSQLYNRDLKERFLKDGLEDDDTRTSYCVYLIQAANFENLIKKDIYDFSDKDIKDCFSNVFTESHTSLRVMFSIMKKYADWATDRGLNKSGANVFNALDFNLDILPMLNVKDLDKNYITEEELWEIAEGSYKDDDGDIIPYCQNYQDAVCMVLPFYGVKGNKNAELRNLKISDILEDNKVILTNEDESTRTIELPEKVIKLLKGAYLEKEYVKRVKNKKNDNKKTVRTVDLEDSNYILRKAIVARRNENNDVRIGIQTIPSRVKKALVEAGYEKLSINNIFDSGKLHMLKQIEDENGEPLNADDYKRVVKAFGDKTEDYYKINYWNLKTLYEQLLAISKAD